MAKRKCSRCHGTGHNISTCSRKVSKAVKAEQRTRARQSADKIFLWAKRHSAADNGGRYVAIKIKDWAGYRGPLWTYLGSSSSLAGAKKLVKQGGRGGRHVVIDIRSNPKKFKYWDTTVIKTYTLPAIDYQA